MLVVPWLDLKPHWLSKRYLPATSLFNSSLARICQQLIVGLFHNSWSSQMCPPCSCTRLWWLHCGNLEVLHFVPYNRWEAHGVWYVVPGLQASILQVGCHLHLWLCYSSAAKWLSQFLLVMVAHPAQLLLVIWRSGQLLYSTLYGWC